MFRNLLGESAENPVFIETLARRGYRFIAPVVRDGAPQVEAPSPEAAVRPSPEGNVQVEKPRADDGKRLWKIAVALTHSRERRSASSTIQ
jgi:DNA-binding winged helix-turn-helix (wHTH) protein